MVQITLDNFKNTESLVIYELPEGTSNIRALKAEIEATENIATSQLRVCLVPPTCNEPKF